MGRAGTPVSLHWRTILTLLSRDRTRRLIVQKDLTWPHCHVPATLTLQYLARLHVSRKQTKKAPKGCKQSQLQMIHFGYWHMNVGMYREADESLAWSDIAWPAVLYTTAVGKACNVCDSA
jgi:hypothetical protein